MISAAMAAEGGKESRPQLKSQTVQILKDFLTRVAKLEELGDSASGFLSGFHQSLEFLRRAPIDMESKLMSKIISANETKRMKSYVESGCCYAFDRVQYTSKSKSILTELEELMEDLTVTIRASNQPSSTPFEIDDLCNQLDHQGLRQEEPFVQEHEPILFIASSVGVIYSMLKQDYVMQEKIVGSLSLKSAAGELESYVLMWSLRPYVNDEIMQQAWSLIN
ncbi:hypothetical protein LINPERPRIM_LOCUS27084 [Linum perenne]